MRRPGVAVVRGGADPASQSYVRNKRRAAQKVGIQAFDHDFPDGASEAELLALIDRLNAEPDAHHRNGRGSTTYLRARPAQRSEEHTSELQSLMRNSYAVFCLKKKNHKQQ